MNNTHSEAATETPFDTAKLDRLMEEAGPRCPRRHLAGITSSTCWAATASSSSTRWMRSASAAICRCSSIKGASPKRRPMSAIAWRASSASSGSHSGADRQDSSLGHARRHRNRSPAYQKARRRRQEGGHSTPFLPADARRLSALNSAMSSCVDAQFVPWSGCARSRRQPRSSLCVRPPRGRRADAGNVQRCEAGMSKHMSSTRLREEEQTRDLTFEYCLITAGTSRNRAPSEPAAGAGRHDRRSTPAATIDGYIGDLCRMGIRASPMPS